MSKAATKQENIVEKRETTVPVEPSLRQYNNYGITPPSKFALYRTDNTPYDLEIVRVTNELRQEVFYNNNEDIVQKLTEKTKVQTSKKVKKCNAVAILIFIASVLIIALYVLGKYIQSPISQIPYLLFVTDRAGLNVIFDLINVFLKGSVIEVLVITKQIAVAAVALMSIIITISSLFIMRRPGIGKAMKLALMLNFVLTVLIAVMVFVNKGTQLPVGYYILFGLTFLSMICGMFSKGVSKNKEKKRVRRNNGLSLQRGQRY